MRTHKAIIQKAGLKAVSDTLRVSVHTVNAWATRNSIPGEYWRDLAENGWATLDELASAAAEKRASA